MKSRLFIVISSLVCVLACAFGLAACGENKQLDTHSHSWAQTWQSNETHHWHDCTADGCTVVDNTQKDGYAVHDFTNGNCICGKEKPADIHTHIWAQAWQSNETHHWHNCTADGCTVVDNTQKDAYAEHNFTNGDCVCGQKLQLPSTDGLEYTLNADGESYSCSGIGDSSENDIVIASVYNGKPVNGITENAFQDCSSLTSVTLPDSVRRISSYAFRDCSSLTTIQYTGDVAGWCAITGLENLMQYGVAVKTLIINETEIRGELIIPDSVTTISSFAFGGCGNLESIIIPDSVTSIGERAFKDCNILTIYCEATNKPSGWNYNWNYSSCPVVWGYPENDKDESGYAYALIDGIRYSIKDGVVTVEKQASNIVTANIAGEISYNNTIYSVNAIRANAFRDCSSLTSITLPFVGASKDGTTNTHFGYIFGASSYSDNPNCVPSSLKTVILTGGEKIADYAFRDCNYLTNVIISDSVTNIGIGAFQGCTSLTSIAVPDSVTTMGNTVFQDCTSLASAVIGNGVTNIGYYVFQDCSSLKSVTIGNGVTKINSNSFANCKEINSINYLGDIAGWCGITGLNYLMQYGSSKTFSINGNKITELVIPDGVTSIPTYAFYGCDLFTSVSIGDNVKTIGQYAFFRCSSITRINIGNSVTSIGICAFMHCSSITSVVIPDSVTSISSNAFQYCNSLESITIPFVGANKSGTDSTHFGYLFGAKSYSDNPEFVPTSLKTVIITGGNKIASYAFQDCSSLTSVVIPDSVTSNGGSVFKGCSSLTSITLPFLGASKDGTSNTNFAYLGYLFGAKSYSENTKYVPSSLKSVIITGGDSIAENAFRNCSNITSVIIKSGVKTIENYAFYNCGSLVDLTLPDTVTSLGEYMFFDSNQLKYNEFGGALYIKSMTNPYFALILQKEKSDISCNIHEDTKLIAPNAFNRSSLTSIQIGSSVTNIGDNAFYYCTSLTSLTISDSVTDIGNSAFYYCTSLTDISFGNALERIGDNAFYSCTSLTDVIIPDTVTSIGENAFMHCDGLETITLPFVGASKDGTSNTHFGYIFGAASQTGNSSAVPSSLKSVVLTGGDKIADYAFKNCGNLHSIIIPACVTSVGYTAFADCIVLTIYCEADSKPSGWNDYWNNASCPVVWDCLNNDKDENGYAYTVIDGIRYSVKDGVAAVEKQARNIVTANIAAVITYKNVSYSVTSISSVAFKSCSSLTSVTIPGSVTNIGNSAFQDCRSLSNINYLGDTASWCNITGLDYLMRYSTNKTLYLNGTKITELVIPDSETNIPAYAFYGCSSITSVIIGNNVTAIGDYAFSGCSSITSVTIGCAVTDIGQYAFNLCSSIASINYTGDMASWCGITGLNYLMQVSLNKTFSLNGTEITELVIPDSVTSIPAYAFYGCDSLTSVTMSNAVTSIGKYAFGKCSSLTSIVYSGTKEEWNAVYKAQNWNSETGKITVHCSDEDIEIG